MDDLSIYDILYVYESEISKGVKHKKKLVNFERHKMEHIISIYNRLKNRDYKIRKYHIFLIYEPKCRIIMSLDLEDKIINHYFTRYHLIPKLSKYLDIRNVATRSGMGTDYGIRLTKKYIEQMKKYDNFYVLKLDISKYFYSISHEVLKSMLKKDLNEWEYDYISKVIDSTDEDYIKSCIDDLGMADLPTYKKGYGLGIGNMTSQFLSIYYLSSLDHYIIHDLHLSKMIRYMDDYVILHENKEYLKECLVKIKDKLTNTYKLNCNIKKTNITSIKEGFTFLGYFYKVENKKTIIHLRGELKRKVYKTLNHWQKIKNKTNFPKFYSVINNYNYTFKYTKESCIKDKIKSIV